MREDRWLRPSRKIRLVRARLLQTVPVGLAPEGSFGVHRTVRR